MFTLAIALVESIGEKIWHNECGKNLDKLTHWGQGEEFASFGVCHFIWYSQNKKGPFEETFPNFLLFLKNKEVEMPSWLALASFCPWSSREEFYAEFTTAKMKELRDFLFKTKDLQVLFIQERLEKSLPHMTEKLSQKEREKVLTNFKKLSQTQQGLYALTDYLNFKGAGTSESESYQGKRWGLLQVLLTMSSSENELEAFAQAAKHLLIQRVALSPPDRKEERWLPGWLNRINTYTKK